MKRLILAAAAAIMVSGPLAAMELASQEQAKAALSGNTVMGTMTDGSTYAEYYAADGSIRANGYSGYWGMVGDRACFTYDNVAVECWHLKVDGNFISWVQGGKLDGTGSLLPGNPNKY